MRSLGMEFRDSRLGFREEYGYEVQLRMSNYELRN